MNKPINPIALFRLTVLGPLASRSKLERGELTSLLKMLARQYYQHPSGRTIQVSERTIERWYYNYLRHGFDGLIPEARCDKGQSALASTIQEAILEAKRKNPGRSINQLIRLLEAKKLVGKNELSRSSVHRLLKAHGLSKRIVNDSPHIERRCFEAHHAGDIWYGDVMHGPRIHTDGGYKKTYLVTLLDDASRLICHSAFYFDEGALSVEHALKQALLKRGLPKKLVFDNGSGYRTHSMKNICALLNIQLIYCRPYEPEGKGKLERWHRTCRAQFLPEIELEHINNLDKLNTRLWVWVEQLYHQTKHSAFDPPTTPLARWQDDLLHVTDLSHLSKPLDEYFYHYHKRTVRKDGTISWHKKRFEVPYQYAGDTLYLIVEPHTEKPIRIESLTGEDLGEVVPLDVHSNLDRARQRPAISSAQEKDDKIVEQTLTNYEKQCGLDTLPEEIS